MPPPLHLVELAADFWHRAGLRLSPPYDIERACIRAAPLSIEPLPDVSDRTLVSWLLSTGIQVPMPRRNRRLHGSVVVYRGHGFLFVNEADSPEERRFTVAHEVGHFLSEYLSPRKKALDRLGPGIIEVLDGQRRPTSDERVDAILTDVSLPLYIHASERTGLWGCDGLSGRAEAVADQLALELLAPEGEVRRRVRLDSRQSSADTEASIQRTLRDVFALPEAIASSYARRLAWSWTGGPSVREKLGFI